MVNEPGGGGGGSSSGYKSFNDPTVKVNIASLLDYYQEMLKLQRDAAMPATMEVSAMTLMIQNGLAKPGGAAGVFPEGAQAARLLRQRQSDFQYFMKDVLEGIRNIGSAAAVVAEIYQNSDSTNAANINDVAFAFSDPSANKPRGFRRVESWSEYEQRMAQQMGTTAMAAMGSDTYARVIHPASGVTIYLYPDGSSKQVTTTTDSSGKSVTATTIFGTSGTTIQTTTEEKVTVNGGTRVNTTVARGDDQNGSTSTTSTVTDSDGSITVTNQTSTTTDGKVQKGEPSTVTIQPGDHNNQSPAPGPVEEAEKRTGTSGTDEFVNAWGPRY